MASPQGQFSGSESPPGNKTLLEIITRLTSLVLHHQKEEVLLALFVLFLIVFSCHQVLYNNFIVEEAAIKIRKLVLKS